jgi:hypothetical protein
MAQELERGFWAMWSGEQHTRNLYAALTTIYPELGDATVDRLKALGIGKAAGMLFESGWGYKGHIWDDSKIDDWYAFAKWGASFKPKQFFPGVPTE